MFGKINPFKSSSQSTLSPLSQQIKDQPKQHARFPAPAKTKKIKKS